MLSPAALLELPVPERHAAKRFFLAKNASRGFFERGKFRVELRDLRESGPALECFFSADSLETGRPVALGASRVRVEKIVLPNPPAKVPDGKGGFLFDPKAALREVLSQTVGLIVKPGGPDSMDSIGRTTLVTYPDAGSGGTTCDGMLEHDESLSFANLRAAAGNAVNLTDTANQVTLQANNSITDVYDFITRIILTYDTRAIPAAAPIFSATHSLGMGPPTTDLGDTSFHLAGASPAADNTLAASDYANVQRTSFGSFPSLSSIVPNAINDMPLNASGIAAIAKGGITKFSLQLGWDLTGTYTGTWSAGAQTKAILAMADFEGTTADPKLTVEYAGKSRNFTPVLFSGRR
ncbi:MAG: hypothetical protein AB1405_04990 [Bdellovibrionota bacterium]